MVYGSPDWSASPGRKKREALWEQRLKIGAKHFGVDLRKLPSSKSALEKVRLAAWLKRTTAVSNGWLARRLDMVPPSASSQFLRRFRLAGHEDEKRLRPLCQLSRHDPF